MMQENDLTIQRLENENRMLRQRVQELETAERKYAQARKVLKNQRLRLFSLLNRLPAFVYLQAPDHGIRFANRYFKKHFGWKPGLKCHEIFRNKPDPCPDCKTFRVFETNEPQRWEWDSSLDGLSYEVLDYPFIDFDGTLLVLELGLDITERKRVERDLRTLQAELEKRVEERTMQLNESVSQLLAEMEEGERTAEALRRSEERYALAIAGANDGIWDRDLTTGEVHFSPRWKNILGFEDHEIANDINEWKSRIHTDDYQRVMNSLESYLDGCLPSYEVEFRMRDRGGGYRWIQSRGACLRDERGNPCRIAGSHTDITYRKQMEGVIRSSEKKYRKIFEESKDVIFIFDADARMVDINPSACELFGYSREELFSLDVATHIYRSPEDRERFLRSLFASGYVRDMETTMKKKGGELLTVHISASLLKNAEDVVTGYMGIIHDMTEHKKLEQQLLHAQKMESIGLLAGGIAHDFNNLLTAISGYGETIRDNIPAHAPLLSTSIEQVMHAAERARELTHNLLAVSRKQIINPKPVPINDLIAGMNNLITRIIGEDVELTTCPSRRRLTVMADRGQLEQVLINLAANARDAMPDGGSLRIEVGQAVLRKSDKRAAGHDARGPHALIAISDTGIGMDEKTRQKIFEPFFTTKEVGKGTGLGLSISYGIIRQHNGIITVESEPGKGTTFTIHLPLISIDVEPETASVPLQSTTGNETVLVVEDEEIVRNYLRDVLRRAGYTVITASDGAEAMVRFHQDIQDIALVITDVVMPKKNGKEIYEEISRIRPEVRFVFISGYTADVIIQKGIFDAGVDFVTKPFMKNDILQKVREVLDRDRV